MQNQGKKIKNQPTMKPEIKQEANVEEQVKKDSDTKMEETKPEEKKKEEKKTEKKEISKKIEAIVNGKDLPISTKHSMAICNFIRGKRIEGLIPELEKVIKLKTPMRMKGEIPHRHGNIMSGRYPINACKAFINLLKSLQANANVNGIENPRIVLAKANKASRPYRRGGRERFKRTNVLLIAKERENKPMGEKK